MNENLLIEPADFLDLWQEKHFLGQEFLTWLWIVSEINGNYLPLTPGGSLKPNQVAPPSSVELWVENRLTLESGLGQERKVVTCQDPEARWAEAHTALRLGKKLSRARLKVVTEEKEWSLSLSADTLTPQAVKFPATFDTEEEEEGSEAGMLLERIALMEELTGIIGALFHQFLQIRLSYDWEQKELPRLNEWLSQQ